jgi:alkanesulfonate monooxygenase SsuD/methylene tetrahydromethanopterin reductase-like flavin-dependent oxidoreductase (luciferase family)
VRCPGLRVDHARARDGDDGARRELPEPTDPSEVLMVSMVLRFDLRNPAFAGVSAQDRVQAAVEMAAWADTRGAVSVSFMEHHGSDDGYLPSPVVVAAAVAARTSTCRIGISALLAPFYDPIRLAEDLAVLDNLSGGRVDIVLGSGYVEEEFTLYGVDKRERGRRMTETVETLRAAWTGEPFEYRGRTVRVTPAPTRAGGPRLVLGGSSDAAARRAARLGDGFVPSNSACWQAYRDEMARLGKDDPGEGMGAFKIVNTVIAEDPDRAWDELAPYFLHDMNTYGGWLEDNGMDGPYATTTLDDLAATGAYRIVTPDAYAEELRPMGDFALAMFHPMVGGIPPAQAWESLRLFDEVVVPALAPPA